MESFQLNSVIVAALKLVTIDNTLLVLLYTVPIKTFAHATIMKPN